MEINLKLQIPGGRRYEKVSYPIRYGRLAEIKTFDHCFQFNLNGEIKFLQGTGRDWPHPSEWLKRTPGNHWVYYDSGGYNRIFDYLGEYYLPCFTYQSNNLWDPAPFKQTPVREALAAFRRLSPELKQSLEKKNWSAEERAFLIKTIEMDTPRLEERAGQLISLLQGRVTVLPPDSRHVDYDLIPLILADGCLYHCSFCRVKSSQDFRPRSRRDVLDQLRRIKGFYGPDLRNYNSLFLGQHDALNCDGQAIVSAALSAYSLLEFERSYLEGSFLFLFGSVDSFLKARESLFEALNNSPYRTYLNLGLESADQECLDLLGKPLRVEKVEEAFQRLEEINRRYDRVEVTANFVIDPELPAGHWQALSRLTRDQFPHYFDKGTIYLSPLSRDGRQELLQRFKELKMKSRRPLYLYLLQRL
jgi:Radical SAM superfamily